MHQNYDVITFISKYIYLRRPKEATFADIIKTATMFIKATFKDSKKVKKKLKLCTKMQSISAFLDITKVADFL